jgi:putative ABC transport system permease protein
VRRSILSSLRAHLGRLAAACLAIVLGVGFGTLALTVHASASNGIDETIGKQNAGVDAVVTPDNGSITKADYEKVRNLPQAVSAVIDTSAYVKIAWPNQVRADWLSISARYDTSRIAGPAAKSGKLPDQKNELALPAKTAEKYKISIGQQLKVSNYEDKSWTTTVVGILDDSTSVGPANAVATAETVNTFEPDSYIRDVKLATAPGVSQAALAAAITAAVPAGLEVFTGEAWIVHEVQQLTNGIDVLGGVFGMFAVIALFVACLVIANTFTIVIAQRTREMALLRCVGASRRQVFSSVLAEATVVGLVASAIGVVFGVALSAIGLTLAQNFDWGLPPVDLHLDLASVFLPLVLGTVATVLAAVVPARRATKVAPLAALRPEAAPAAASKRGVLRLIFGFLLLAGGGLLLAASAMTNQVIIGVAGGTISFLGVLAVGTLLVPALVKLLGSLPARTGVPARIAVANAVRNPRRTAATTSALLIGVTLISLTCVGIASVRKTFDGAMDSEYPVDLTVTTFNEKMPANAATQLDDIKGVNAAVPVRSVQVKAGQNELTVTGIDQASVPTVVHSPQLIDQLKAGTALLDLNTMSMLELKDGANVTIVSGKNKVTLKAVRAAGLDPITVTQTDLQKLAPAAAVSGFWLDSDPKADGRQVIDDVQQSLPTIKELSVSGGLAERTEYTKIFDVLLLVAVGLLGVSVLIALVGVGNTLSLSVLERTRENALLRAMGLTRRQLRGMLAIESLLMALVAAGLGILLGLVYGWTGTVALMGSQVDAGVQYAVPVRLLVTIALVAAVAGLLASVLPARRAARVAPAGALASE